MAEDEIRQYGHPGKYEGELLIAEYIHHMAQDGADEELGDEPNWGTYYWMIDLTKDKADFVDSLGIAMQQAGEPLTAAERNYLMESVGIILEESDTGFVGMSVYDDEETFRKAWSRIETDWEEWLAGAGDIYPRVGRKIRGSRRGPGRGWWSQPRKHAAAARKGWRGRHR